MQEINAWLLKKDFEQGKSLYMKHGTNSYFKTLLHQGPTPFNVKKLGAELKALAPVSPAAVNQKATTNPVVISEIDKSVIKHADNGIITPDIVTKVVQTDIPEPPTKSPSDFQKYLELKELLKATYRQMERNMAELDISENESYLHLCAKNIISLNEKKRDIYKLLDHYDQYECFPAIKQTIIRTPADQIQLLRVSTSKAKDRLKSPTCRDVKATKQLIENNNKRILELGGKVN
jgi:hypothetical protein